jgi:hypothetical protein
MVAQMLSRRGQWLSKLVARPSFAGTSLLERMRSTTFALLGVTAAMGLGLVAVISQQGWPLLPAAPLPGLSVEQAKVHDAVAIRPDGGSSAPGSLVAAQGRRAATDQRADAATPGSDLSGSRQLATAPSPVPADPATGSPAEQPVPTEPAPVTPVPAPVPPPAPVTGPPASPTAPAPPPITASTDQSRGKSHGKYKPPDGSKDKSTAGAGGKPVAGSKGKSPTGSKDKSRSYEPPAPAPAAVKPDKTAEEAVVPPTEDDSSGHPGKGEGNSYGHSHR